MKFQETTWASLTMNIHESKIEPQRIRFYYLELILLKKTSFTQVACHATQTEVKH